MADFDRPDDNNGAWDYYQIYYHEDDDDDDDDYYYTTENAQNKKYKYTNMAGRPEVDMDNLDPDTEIDWGDDDDDEEEEVNTTQLFTPGASSTPYQPQGAAAGPYHGGEEHEMAEFGPEQSGISDTTPLLSPQANQAWAFTEAVYPDADSTKLESFFEEMRNPDPNSTKKLRLMIKMRDAGKKAYPLFTRDDVTKKERINPGLTKEIVKVLGPEAEKQIAETKQLKKEAKKRRDAAERQVKINTKTRQQLAKDREELQRLENEQEQANIRLQNMAKEGGTIIEMKNDRQEKEKRQTANRKRDIEATKKKIKDHEKALNENQKAKKDAAHWDRIYNEAKQKEMTLERNLNRTKPLDELEERQETLKRQNVEDQCIKDDGNAFTSEKQAAEDRIAERNEQLATLDPQIQERQEALPLRERVKNIFKKYGWTLQAIVLATGLVLGAVAFAAVNGLKAGTKAVGNGLKAVGKTVGLPPTRAHRLDCQLYLQIGWTGSLLPRRARLAANPCCGSLLYGKAF